MLNLDPGKASGPDDVPTRLLEESAIKVRHSSAKALSLIDNMCCKVCIVALDIKDTYNQVWHNGLCVKLML